jgi:hypothetical protein
LGTRGEHEEREEEGGEWGGRGRWYRERFIEFFQIYITYVKCKTRRYPDVIRAR